MYYKESFDLITCTERKIAILFEEIAKHEENDVSELFNRFLDESQYKSLSMDDISGELSYILAQYGKIRNNIIDYYYPGSETKSYEDIYGSDDE